MKSIIKSVVVGSLVMVPSVVFAQATFKTSNFAEFVDSVITLIDTKLVPLVVALTLLVFIWGVFKFINKADEEKAREEGRKFMFWGVIGFFVMVSIWGLLKFLEGTFGFTNIKPTIPTLKS